MPTNIIIPATKEAEIIGPMTIGERLVTYQVIGTLESDESINFEIEDESGWRTLTIDDTEVAIILGNDQVVFYGPSYVRINKSDTDAAVGLRTVSA